MRRRADKPHPVPANIGPGTVLSRRFRLVEPIGSGGMAVVWRAEHMDLEIPVALKMLRPVDAHSSVARARFEKEARTVAALRHPNVVQILEYGVHEHVPYLAMELLEGETLAKRLDRLGKLDAASVVWIVEQVARPLDKAHGMGIVHRDIKPDNIFLQATDEGEIVKLVDFGIAKIIGGEKQDSLTKTDAVIGTTHYLSPERARGKKPLDGRVDLWALAVVVYECVVGQRPFDEHADDLIGLLRAIAEVDYPPPSMMVPTPPEFDAWMDKALNPNPDRRMTNASEMASTLRDALLPGTVSTPTGIAFEALEAEMLPFAVEQALSDEEPVAAVEAFGGTRTLTRVRPPRARTDVRPLPPPPLPLPAVERAVRSGPQLRRADLSVEPVSYEVEPSREEPACAEVDGMPALVHEAIRIARHEQAMRTQATPAASAPGTLTGSLDDDPTVAMDAPPIPSRPPPAPLPQASQPPAESSRSETLPPTAPSVRAPGTAKRPKRLDWRLIAAATVSMFVAAGVGVTLVRWFGTRSQPSDASVPVTVTSVTSARAPAALTPPPDTTETSPPAIPVSALPPTFSVAPPVVDVERLPVPDSEPPSPSSTHVRPPRHNAGRGAGTKPHEVFGL